jgi:hypothetical protein
LRKLRTGRILIEARPGMLAGAAEWKNANGLGHAMVVDGGQTV